jgi:hypothetical protein
MMLRKEQRKKKGRKNQMSKNEKLITLNAVIESATITTERGFMLDAWIHLKLENGFNQGFGGYALYLDKTSKHHSIMSPGGHFIFRVMEIAGVENWDKLKGQAIRIRKENGLGSTIDSIGHIIKDDWFCPREDFRDIS